MSVAADIIVVNRTVWVQSMGYGAKFLPQLLGTAGYWAIVPHVGNFANPVA
ncbi:hypothetical protein DACRYDRAFT_103964 [Dacryopinax primogenitus]|uniref:Uncharacterized protein n=1 Tax=Dacryopinax primogenitus (strain DJM 731) TaxID=1858805 RepID=M5G5E5_DACPD|nr:uncharacterized protein DACRYDRAFT_103964 [Dacryopinax primogenitus]EJU05476.1 hypothetical protein DACRYDRAFT_103964 [Dacryopinax primogenitus]